MEAPGKEKFIFFGRELNVMESPCHRGTDLREVRKPQEVCSACGQPKLPEVDYLVCVCGNEYELDGSTRKSAEEKKAEAKALAEQIKNDQGEPQVDPEQPELPEQPEQPAPDEPAPAPVPPAEPEPEPEPTSSRRGRR